MILRYFWDDFGICLRHFWHDFWTMLVSFWYNFIIILKYVFLHFFLFYLPDVLLLRLRTRILLCTPEYDRIHYIWVVSFTLVTLLRHMCSPVKLFDVDAPWIVQRSTFLLVAFQNWHFYLKKQGKQQFANSIYLCYECKWDENATNDIHVKKFTWWGICPAAIHVIPIKRQYMTLGPKFYIFSVWIVCKRRCFQNR